ncbi:Protein AATF [Trichinella papuae]|uniref:Protein AATF n=1 Tax=Trichinella papuae TaxID=268474 RepID=A0A0V1MKJ0_9BILA|nr:Protein AATF [Trichinella papuae]
MTPLTKPSVCMLNFIIININRLILAVLCSLSRSDFEAMKLNFFFWKEARNTFEDAISNSKSILCSSKPQIYFRLNFASRRIRIQVMSKLVNFMAPVERSKMTNETRDELFASLFGSRHESII